MTEEVVDVKVVDQFGDQRWRINNLYYIINDSGDEVKFVPNDMQNRFWDEMWYRNVILKGRQHGFTTFIDLLMLDCCVWFPNQTAGIIAHTLDDVKKIFRRKIRHPYDRLPAEIRAATKPTNDTQNELIFANKSEISVDTGFRGGTYNYLHISEYGQISLKTPEKAIEIKTGSFNTVHPGNFIFVESTGHGRGGEFYELCKGARDMQIAGKRLTQLDFLFHFYPWWMNPKYQLSEDDTRTVIFTSKDRAYFDRVARAIEKKLASWGETVPWLRAWVAQGRAFSLQQMAWYVTVRKFNGDEMKREYPSHDEEPFEAVLLGAYFARQMQETREQGRITRVPHERGLPVDTWWDLGLRDKMAVWFMQTLGREIRAIDYWEDTERSMELVFKEQLAPRAAQGYFYRHHVAPHDLAVRDLLTKKSRYEGALRLGYRFIVAEQFNQDDQIEAARNLIPSVWFDEEHCSVGIAHLEEFRKEWNDHLGTFMDVWRHDEHSHCASAFMTGAMMLGKLQTGQPKARQVVASPRSAG